MKKSSATEEPRKTISVRNVSERRWNAVQEKSEREGVAVWVMLDEALDYILSKKWTPK